MKIRLGTRGSQLALIQADRAEKKLKSHFPDLHVEIRIIQTRGDLDLKSPLSEIGGKGVFIKELEVSLLNNEIDIAVHSMKDITSALLPDLQLSAFLKAEAVADVLVLYQHRFENLPLEAKIATGSLRRRALLKKLRPDLQFVDIRGNVLTRIAKLNEGIADGLLLSEAGLMRLGLQNQISHRFDPNFFCPAPGQGVIALETRANDDTAIALCQQINDQEQCLKASTEMAFLEKIQFDCRIPLGLYAQLSDDKTSIYMTAFLSNQSMNQFLEEKLIFPVGERMEKMAALAERFMDWRRQHDTG